MPNPALFELHAAKSESDNQEYKQKAERLHRLMFLRPQEFEVSEEPAQGGHPGIRHTPTNFQLHVPRKYIPASIWRRWQDRPAETVPSAEVGVQETETFKQNEQEVEQAKQSRLILQDELRMWAHVDDPEVDYAGWESKLKSRGLDEQDVQQTVGRFRQAREKRGLEKQADFPSDTELLQLVEAEPTDGQIEAGNYRKARVRVHGLEISIENPRGSVRRGVDKDGRAWSRTLTHHYGDLKRVAEGADGDPPDCFIGPHPESQKVWVVDQVDQDGEFDEVKVMLGFDSRKEAEEGYLSNYEEGWTGLGTLTYCTINQLKEWLGGGCTPSEFARRGEQDEDKVWTEWVGFDLDGTLAHYEEWDGGKIGHPVEEMVSLVKDYLGSGMRVKIFTTRAQDPENIPRITSWCKKHLGQELEVTNVKDPGCIKIYDDRAVGVVKNEGKLLTKEAVIKKEGDKYVLYTKDMERVLGRHDTRQEAIKQEYAIQKSQEREKQATTSWTPDDQLRQQVWEAEHTGEGVTDFPPLPQPGQQLTAYTDPGSTSSPALPGGVRGDYQPGQSYPYETWDHDYTQALVDARTEALKRYPQLEELPTEGQNLLIQHTYNAYHTPFPNLYQGLLAQDPQKVEQEYTLATNKWPGLAHRNAYYEQQYVRPLTERWRTPQPAVQATPTPTPTPTAPSAQNAVQQPPTASQMDADTMGNQLTSTVELQTAPPSYTPTSENPPADWKPKPGGGYEYMIPKQGSAEPPATGPEALRHALSQLDLDRVEQEQREVLKSGAKSKRSRAVQLLNAVEGMRGNDVRPEELMISRLPILPAQFRPFSAQGTTFIPGDANVLYKDLFNLRDAYGQERELWGEEGAGEARRDLYQAVKASYGYGEPTNEKARAKGVSGFMKQVLGNSPKYSVMQRRLVSKPVDSSARSTIVIDPELNLDEVGLPREMAWTLYGPWTQRRLVKAGVNPGKALELIRDRDPQALRALQLEMSERLPVISRAPTWHKFGIMSAKPKLIDGKAIAVNPYTGTGYALDFDGDAMNVHLPASEESQLEARTKLLPSSQLFKTRDTEQVMHAPKHEFILGLAQGVKRPGLSQRFPDMESFRKAQRQGLVSLSDDIELDDQDYPSFTKTTVA